MRKSRWLAILIAVMLVMTMCVGLLAACDPTDEPTTPDNPDKPDNGGGDVIIIPPPDSGDDGDDTAYYDAMELLGMTFDAIDTPDNVACLDFAIDLSKGGVKRKVALRGNLVDTLHNKIAFTVDNVTDSAAVTTDFGLYLLDGKIYINLGDGKPFIYLEDFDANYIISILSKIPDLLDGLLSDSLKNTLNGVLGIISPMLFNTDDVILPDGSTLPSYVKETADGVNTESIAIELKLNSFVTMLSDMLGSTDIGALLAGFGVNLGDINLSAILGGITNVLAWVNDALPQMQILLNSSITDGRLNDMGMTVYDKDPSSDNYNKEMLDISAKLAIGDAVDDSFEFPEAIDDYTNFSFTNIQFDIDLTLKTSDGKLDVGTLVNGFTGKETLPAELLFLDASMGMRLKFKMDLDLNYDHAAKDKNLLMLELYMLDGNGNVVVDDPAKGATPQLGLYYKNGAAYVNLGKLLPNYYTAKSLKIEMSLMSLMNGLVDLVSDAIDKALGTDFDSVTGGQSPLAASPVVTVEAGEDGEPSIISPSISNLVAAIASIAGLQDYIVAEGDAITVTFNNGFIEQLKALVPTINFALPASIGDIVLSINLASYGIDNIDVSASIDKLGVNLNIHSFMFGYEPQELDAYIDMAVGEVGDYTSSVGTLLDSILSGTDINARLKVSFDKGTYDFVPLLMAFGLTQLEGQQLPWTFTGDSVIDLGLTIQIALDKADHRNSKLKVEIKANEDIMIGSTVGMKKGDTIIGIYGINNMIYIDLADVQIAKINLPKLAAELDFTHIIYKLIGDLDYNLVFDLGSLLVGDSAVSAEQIFSNASEVTTVGELETTPFGGILISLNSDALAVSTSLRAIFQLLKSFNVNVDVPFLNDLDLSIDLSLDRLEGITLDIEGGIVPKIVDGVHDYDTGFALRIEAGTSGFPINIGHSTIELGDIVANSDQYKTDLIEGLVGVIGKAELNLSLNLETIEETMDITRIINNILASMGKQFEIPIKLNLENWSTTFDIAIKWNLNLTDFAKTQLLLEARNEGKLLLGLYLLDNDIMVDLTGLGLFKLKISNSSLVTTITSALAGVIDKLGELDLTELLNDLIGDLSLSGALTAPDGEGEGSETPTDPEQPTDMDQAQTDALIKYILSAISAQDVRILVDMTSQIFDSIMKNVLGFGFGIDIGISASIDLVEGELQATLGVENMELHMGLALEVGNEELDLGSIVDRTDFPTVDATSGRTMAKTLLDNLNIALYLDVANNTVDTGGSAYTRVVIEKLTAPKVLTGAVNTPTAPAGAFLVSLNLIDEAKYNNSDQGSSTTFVYLLLNYETGKLSIYICEGQLTLSGIDVAGAINTFAGDLSFDLDLVGTLAPVFDDLLTKMSAASDAPAVANSSGGLAMAAADESAENSQPQWIQDITADPMAFIVSLFDEININMSATSTFNVDVSLDPYTFNKLIDDAIGMIFGPNTIVDLLELAPTMFSVGDFLAYVDWNRTSKDAFWERLRVQVVHLVKDLLNNVSGGLGNFLLPGDNPAIISGLLNNVHSLIMRLLPLPLYNEAHVGLNIMDGTFTNIYVTGYDRGESLYAPDGSVMQYKAYSKNDNVEYTLSYGAENHNSSYFTEIWLYNASPAAGQPNPDDPKDEGGVVSWGDLRTLVEYEPLNYANSDVGKGRLIAENYTNKTVKYQKGGLLFKGQATFKITGEWNGDTFVPYKTPKDVSAANIDVTSERTYAIRASVTLGSGGNATTKTLDTKLVILPDYGDGEITIDDMSMYAYEDFPTYINLHWKSVDGQNSRDARLLTSEITISDAAPTGFDGHMQEARATFGNGRTTTINIHYLDSAIASVNSGDEIEVDLYVFDPASPDTSLDYYLSQKYLYFSYGDGFADVLEIKSWDTSEALDMYRREPDDLSGAIYTIYATVGDGAIEQRVPIRFVVKTKTIQTVEINGSTDAVQVDPYDYYMFKNGVAQNNPYPDEITVYYYEEIADGEETYVDAYSEKVKVTWQAQNGGSEFYEWDIEGGVNEFNMTASLDNEKYTGIVRWTKEIPVKINRNEIERVYFDDKDTPLDKLSEDTFVIDPFLFNINAGAGIDNFPANAYVKFTNGKIIYLPIAWTIPDGFDVEYAEANEQFELSIGFDTVRYAQDGTIVPLAGIAVNQGKSILQTYYQNVRVEGLAAQGIDIDGSAFRHGTVYRIDPVRVKYMGEAVFPEEVNVAYTNGTSATLPVLRWEFDYDAITLDGAEGLVAKVFITEEDSFEISVEVVDRTNIALAEGENMASVNVYDFTYDEKGNKVFAAFGDHKNFVLTSNTYAVNMITTKTVTDSRSPETPFVSYPDGKEGKTVFERTLLNSAQLARLRESMTGKYTDSRDEKTENYGSGRDAYTITTVVEVHYAIGETIVDETLSLPITWDVSKINFAPTASVGTAKVMLDALQTTTAYEDTLTFDVTVSVEEMKLIAVGGTDYTLMLKKNGEGLTQSEISTKLLTRNLTMQFQTGTAEDGSAITVGRTMSVTIDISKVNLSLASVTQDADGNLTHVIIDGKELTYPATLTIMAGDTELAQTITIKVDVLQSASSIA